MRDHFKQAFDATRPNSSDKPQLLKRFSPYDLDDQQVYAQATGRDQLVTEILGTIRDNANRNEPPNQHLLVLGPRGMGKSFLVRWVQAEIAARERVKAVPTGAPDEQPSNAPIRFVRLPEEQLNISAPELFLDEIRRILEQRPADTVRVRWRSGGEAEWRTALEALKETIAALPGFEDGRGLVVVSIENFDLLVEEVFAKQAAQSRLRAMLAAEPRLMLFTTATRPPDQDASKRLFLAFERKELRPWRSREFVAFYRHAFRGGMEITTEVEAKIHALAHFLGGSPRLAVLMGDILHSDDALSAIQTLDQLVDERTPYYQDRILARLKPKPRWLLDEMLRGGEPCSQTELAERVGASQSEISQYVSALLRDHIVVGARETGGRKNLYRVADRVFAHFYRKRYLADDSHSPLASMVDFLEAFYNQKELLEQIERLNANDDLEKTQLMTQALWRRADWHGVPNADRRWICRRWIKDAIEALGAESDAPLAHELGTLEALIRDRDTAGALKAARQMLESDRTTTERAVIQIAIGSIYTTLPDDDRAIALLQTAVDTAEQAGRSLHSLALEALANAEAYRGDADAADIYFQQARDAALAIGDHERHAWVIASQLWHFNLTERWDAFDKAFDAGLDALTSSRKNDILARIYNQRCYREWRSDDLNAALAAAERAVELARDSDDDATLALVAANYSASLSQLERYDEALEVTRLQQQAAQRADDEDRLLDGAKRELRALLNLKQHKALIERAPEVLERAQRLDDLEGEISIQGMIADAHQALEHPKQSLDAQWRAADLSVRGKDDELFSKLHNVLAHRLGADRRVHADDIINAYLRWIDRITPTMDTDVPALNRLNYLPRWRFDDFAFAVTSAGRWPELGEVLGQWERDHPAALKALTDNSTAIGDAVVERADADGSGPAFSTAAGFLRTVGAVLTSPDPTLGLSEFMKALAHVSCTRFITGLKDPGLLRDLAQEVREQLEDNDIARGLEAAALYREQGDDPVALEHVDPDIREAVMTLLDAYGDASDTEDTEGLLKRIRYRGPGLLRVDARVSAEDREVIVASLAQTPIAWPRAPRLATAWTDLSPERALEPVVAILGAAREAARHRTGKLFLDLVSDEQGFGAMAARVLVSTRAVRETTPEFYAGWTLVECLVPRPAGQPGDGDWASLRCLLRKDVVLPLLGVSDAIHELNRDLELRLTHPAQAAAYLRFFCSEVRGDDGPFHIIEKLAQLPLSHPLEPDDVAKLRKHVGPIKMEAQEGEKRDDLRWSVRAVVQYGGGLFVAGFILHATGEVEMTDDETVVAIGGIRRERLVSAMRWFDGAYPPSTDTDG